VVKTKSLPQLQEELHNQILRARNIENLLIRPQFERLWTDSNEAQKKEATEHIKEFNKAKLLDWMRTHPSIDLGEKLLRDLIPIAKQLKIKNYSRLGRIQLIQAIREMESSCGTQ